MNVISSPAASLDDRDAISATLADLHVFLVYENLAAALRASDSLTVLSKQDPDGLAVKLFPWSFAALAESQWHAQALGCLERAHLIVIAAYSVSPRLPAAIEEWLRTSLALPRDERLAVATLLHDHNGPDRAESPRLRSVQRIAREAGCAFFAPGVTGDLASIV